MRRIAAVGSVVTFAYVISVLAQYGTAPNNYYPYKYNGSTFKGIVTNNQNDQLTLTYTKKGKDTIFRGKFEAPCSVPRADGSGRGMVVSDISVGTVMTAYFNTNTRNVTNQKVKEGVILAISFDVWKGQKVSEDEKLMYFCSPDKHSIFRFWK
jgi:hypothetical protein